MMLNEPSCDWNIQVHPIKQENSLENSANLSTEHEPSISIRAANTQIPNRGRKERDSLLCVTLCVLLLAKHRV